MTYFAAWSGLAHRSERGAKGRTAGGATTDLGQDKTACHERPKPLARLGFSCAGRSVACRKHGFHQRFQCADLPRGVSIIGGSVR